MQILDTNNNIIGSKPCTWFDDYSEYLLELIGFEAGTLTVGSIQLMTGNGSDEYVRDWYKNFRIGVFNNALTENITYFKYNDENGDEDTLIVDSTNFVLNISQQNIHSKHY